MSGGSLERDRTVTMNINMANQSQRYSSLPAAACMLEPLCLCCSLAANTPSSKTSQYEYMAELLPPKMAEEILVSLASRTSFRLDTLSDHLVVCGRYRSLQAIAPSVIACHTSKCVQTSATLPSAPSFPGT